MPEDYILCTSTASSKEEARKIAMALVTNNIVACVNMVPRIISIYTWKGELNEDEEVLLIMKTRRHLFPALEAMIKEHHSYECPEIIAVPIIEGYQPYLDWIKENTP
ncbi:MAG: divalent-cation tolerance protein CutA [Promethearchaeota archaeon]